MAEYIEREAAIESLPVAWDSAINALRNAPSADVAPVVHGRWIYAGKYGEYECSICHGIDADCSDYYSAHLVTEQDYCPNCGARMDEVG